jgi:hypothetical protein
MTKAETKAENTPTRARSKEERIRKQDYQDDCLGYTHNGANFW